MGLVRLILELLYVGIDVIMFFVVVRLLLSRWPANWLVSLDNIGARLVDSFADAVAKCHRKISMTTLTSQGRLVWGLVALIILRTMIASLSDLH